jgi:HEAT repeat protein
MLLITIIIINVCFISFLFCDEVLGNDDGLPPFDEYVKDKDLDSVVEYLKDPSSEIRMEAYEVLKNWKLEIVESYLIEGLGDYDTDVRWKVANILDDYGWEPKNKVHKVRYALAKKDWDEAVSYGKDGEVHVLRMLKKGDVEVRKGLVVAIGKSGNMRYYDTIRHIYRHDENQEVRYLAFEAMNEIGEKQIEEGNGGISLSRNTIFIIIFTFMGLLTTIWFIYMLKRMKSK